MKVALVHDWLTGMRGGEKCLEVFCELFPQAPIFTLFHVKKSVSPVIEQHEIVTSFLNRIPFLQNTYRYYLPFFSSAVRTFDLRGFDLILSSSHCVAKGVRVPLESCHISYVHTPMRYIWDGHDQYFSEKSFFSFKETGMAVFRKRLQQWDVQSNDQVHEFIANSYNVAERIKRLYGREALVVHPPVDWHAYEATDTEDGFYLMVTALAPYKRVDLAIAVANQLNMSLKIVGIGPEEKRLKRMAGPTVQFLGRETDRAIRGFYKKCRAVLFPGEEDFGIVPLEAMASGRPVIAYGKGGVLETIIPLNPVGPTHSTTNPTGVFFNEQSVDALREAIQLFENRQTEFQPQVIREHVESFDRKYFQERIKQAIMTIYGQYRPSTSC